MTKIREYLAYLIQEATQARIAADSYAVEVAKSYSKDKLLRHLSAPRFTLPEIELDIPVLIQESEHQFKFKLSSGVVPLSKKLQSVLQDSLKNSGIDRSISDGQIRQSETFQAALKDLMENTSKAKSINSLISSFKWNALVKGVIADTMGRPVMNKVKPEVVQSTSKAFAAILQRELALDQSKFLDAHASFRTDDIKKVDDAAKIFKIKLKLVEESINHVSVKNDDGGEDEILVL